MFSCRLILGFLAAALIFSTACTRPQSDTSTMKIVLPAQSVGSQSLTASDVLGHVVINVTGEGIPMPILMTWDLCKECPNPTAPSSFTLDIPSGSNRMIQVLAVYMNSSTEKMSFFYGDSTVNLSLAQESVVVPIWQLGAATSIVSGHIAGRFLTAANSGPTGPIDIVYTPPGKPSLVVDRSFIMNGWFDVFGLAGLAFGYRLPDGNLLFGKNLDLNDPVLAASNSVLRAAVPSHMRQQNNNGVTIWKPEEAELHIIGYFGPGMAANNVVCRPSTLPGLTKIAQAGDTSGSALLSSSNAAIPTTDALLSTTTPLSSYYVNGGLGDSNTACVSGTQYASFLGWKPSLIDGNGKDESSGFTVPLAWDAATHKPFKIDQSANRIISGHVLPGVQAVVDGFQLYKRVATDDFQFHSGIDCFAIANGAMGFVPAGSAPIAVATGDFSITSTITASEASSGVSAVMCPLKAGALQPGGVFINKWAFNSGSNNANPQPADGFQIQSDWHNVLAWQCHEAQIQLTAGGNNSNVTNLNSVNFTLGGVGFSPFGVSFYNSTDTSCAGSTITNVSIAAGTTSQKVRFMVTGSGAPVSSQITAQTVAFGGSVTQTSNINVASSGSGAQQLGSPLMAGYSGGGQCFEVPIFRVDSMGYASPSGGAETVSISVTPAGAMGVFSDASCSASISSFTFNASEYSHKVYMKRLTGSGESMVQFVDGALSNPNFDFYVDPMTYVDHLKVQLAGAVSNSPFIGIGDCVPVYVQAYDQANAQVNTAFPNPINIDVGSMSGGHFFSSKSMCDNDSGFTMNYPVSMSNGSSPAFWYRQNSAGSPLIQASNSFRLANSMNNQSLMLNIVNSTPNGTWTLPYAWFDMNQLYNLPVTTAVTSWYSRIGASYFNYSGSGGVQVAVSNIGGAPWNTLYFSGAASTGASLTTSLSGVQDFTIAMRVSFSTPGTQEALASLTTATCTTCNLTREADGSVHWFGNGTAAGLIADSNFHTIVMYRYGTEVGLFVDGVLQGAPSFPGGSAQSEALINMTIGHLSGTTTWLHGVIGDVIVFNNSGAYNDPTFLGLQSTLHSYLSQKFP